MNQLERDNYIHLPKFIKSKRAKDLATRYKQFVDQAAAGGDTQVPNSQSFYNYDLFLELLCEKTPEISDIVGEPVLPTYCYSRAYKQGNTLARHRDREACEVSVTLNLSGDKEWPIFIQKPSGEEVSVTLKPGDGMLYLGCVADHWRNQFEGTDLVQVFLHYVKSRGPNKFAYFDKNKGEGFDLIAVCKESFTK